MGMSDTSYQEGGRLLTAQRRQQIAGMVEQRGVVTAEDLATSFGVSSMTIWRDLAALETAGKLQRVRGGAVKSENASAVEPFYYSKRAINSVKKDVIAHYAAQHFVQDDDIIILEAGTTVMAMVKFLSQHNLTIITNGLGTIYEVAPLVPNVMGICCGGVLREISWTFVGPEAVQFFQHLRARTLFLSATGFTLPEGLTDPNPLENQVKVAMAASAERVIALVDSSKFGQRSLARVVPLDTIQTLITDAEAPGDTLDALRAAGIDVHVAE
jgi:DeoR/GlpR family transcriptional regulator of sugar metabolism